MNDNVNQSGRQSPEIASIHLNRHPTVPRAFVTHPKIKYAVYCLIEGFGYEEQQAIGYFYYLDDVSIKEIAEKTELTENRVLSSIGLYAERLEAKLEFFKRILPYDTSDVLPITEILFHDAFNEAR